MKISPLVGAEMEEGMIMLNQFILEGKIKRWADYGECEDDDESLVITYVVDDLGYANHLDINPDMLPVYSAYIGHDVRIVGKLAGDTLVVEHLEALG